MSSHFRYRLLLTGTVTGAALAATAAGCGSQVHPASSPVKQGTSAAPTKPASSTPLAAPPTIPQGTIPAALVGAYTYLGDGMWNVTLRGDGSYSQWNPAGELDMTGQYGVRGHVAVFSDQATDSAQGTACPEPGAYTWRFHKTVLEMTVEQDDCTVGRIQQWTAGWTKVSTRALGRATTYAAAKKHQ